MKKILSITIAFLSILSFSLKTSAKEDKIDKTLALKAQKYFNQMNNIQGTFNQSASTGEEDSGKFYISKPGKMRLEYKSPVLLVSNGKIIIFKDKKADQTTHLDIDKTPAGIILKKNANFFGKDITVLKTEENLKNAEVTLALKDNKEAGNITLIFTKNPEFKLTSWKVRDPQGVTTHVKLNNIKENVKLANSLFEVQYDRTFSGQGINNSGSYY